jgi:uncharacterized phage protein (TIGR01671 family)
MRELKFRAWDREEGIMISANDWFFGEESQPFKDAATDCWRSFEIMQYTGLKDMNDKEIYIGDIVRYQDLNTEDETWKIANVYWMSWADWANVPFLHPFGSPVCGQNKERGRSVETCYITPPGACEVIGNIWENPELLEAKHE